MPPRPPHLRQAARHGRRRRPQAQRVTRLLELWLLDDDGRMIALGSFRIGADERAEVELPIPFPPSRYRYFDVSLQEDNGNPAHSGISVLRGTTSS